MSQPTPPLPLRFANTRYVGGIDPDLDKSGLVIYDRAENAWCCKTLSQYELQDYLLTNYQPTDLQLVVEAGWLNAGFHHYAGFPKGFETWKEKSKLAYVAQSAVRVGENFGVGKSIVHFFASCGFSVDLFTPVGPKWTADAFKRLTGLKSGYNEEIRDAARAMWTYK